MKDLSLSDQQLANQVLAGDEDAFISFFRSYYPALFRFALVRLGRDEDAAEEVVQVTLSKALGKLRDYRGEAALFTWLCAFCRFEIAEHFRRLGRKPPLVELAEEVPGVRAALESLASAPEDPEEALRRKELGRCVRATLDHLPRRYSRALEWKYVEGLSVKEIARRLGVAPKAAESVLGRARAKFRDGFMALNSEANLVGARS